MGPYTGVRDMIAGQRPYSAFIESDIVYLPLYGCFEWLSTLVFGVTPTAMRLPGALLGVATAFATGLVGYSLLRDRAVFLLAAGIMAILPWDVSLSRMGWEPAAVLPFVLFGVYFIRRGLIEGRAVDIPIGFAMLAVGAYSYRAEAFDAVALTLALCACEYRRVVPMLRPIGFGVVVAAVIVAPILAALFTHPSYFSSGPAQATFGDGWNDGTRHTFLMRYAAQFSPLALFAVGDGNFQHGAGIGVLYWWMLPFIAIGLFAPWRAFSGAARIFCFAWVAIYPIGNGLVNEVAPQHFLRTLIGAPIFTILAAIGCVVAWRELSARVASERVRTVVVTVTAGVVAFAFVRFCSAYFLVYPEVSADDFQFGDREIFAFVRAHAARYRRVCYTVVDGWNWTTLDRYYMSDRPVEPHLGIDRFCSAPHTLYAVGKTDEAPLDAKPLGTVQHRDGTVRAYFFGT